MAADTYPMEVGKNIRGRIDGDTLFLQIDLKKEQGQSKSGKNTLIATTGGNVAVAGKTVNAKLGLNLYK